MKEKEAPSLARRLTLTAVFLIAAVRTVLEAVAPETANDAVDPASTGEERGTTFGFGFCWEKIKTKEGKDQGNNLQRLEILLQQYRLGYSRQHWWHRC